MDERCVNLPAKDNLNGGVELINNNLQYNFVLKPIFPLPE
jgi:hypothetical protein